MPKKRSDNVMLAMHAHIRLMLCINNFNTIGPLIYPYWYNFDYISSLNGSIFYQELTKPTNDSLQFKTIDKMIKRLTGNQKYASSYNFVVNWNLIEPWNYYRYFYFWNSYYTNYEFYNQHTEVILLFYLTDRHL